MIVTLTPNPSVDRTLVVDQLALGAVQRASSGWSEPSGKGVNVSLALRTHGIATRAVLPIGGLNGTRLAAMLDEAGIDHVNVPITGNIRTNVSILEPDGKVTKVNEPGPTLSADEVEALLDATLRAAAQASWLVGSGSLPHGASPDLYARLVQRAHEAGLRVAIDSSGPPLLMALPSGPDLIKPNAHELAEAAGRPVTTVGQAIVAARSLQERGARTVLASLGADGALLVEEGSVLHAEVIVENTQSAVGAGDALLSGFLAGGASGQLALRTALTWAATALQQPGTLLGADIDEDSFKLIFHDRPQPLRRLRAD
ncbi:1-phosphofructokinase family hexose kinase [Streptomyces sp. 3214.6]|uniref:1-phosphofructokinase family hexose kinase n=1 Tax=Streptomyces sp. 3214.6 TaxID=1882757 RepID=UPI00090C2A8B|nr:1-phosphofructokinase family hexose kinase [Streptomyces sp. 3214.6]SHH30860.1 fructose-1-phosphate kinase [Streptomyces sp. 3214.6]